VKETPKKLKFDESHVKPGECSISVYIFCSITKKKHSNIGYSNMGHVWAV